jgi:nucleoid-associated protein YgaU
MQSIVSEEIMKFVARLVSLLAIGMLAIMLSSVTVIAQEEKMTMEEYNLQLAEWQKREADAKAGIATTDAEIAALRAQIAETDQQTASVWTEVYGMLGTDEAGVASYRSQLDGLSAELDALAALSPEELYKRRAEIDGIEKRLAEMKESKISWLSEMQDKIAGIEGKIAQLRASMPKAIYDEYTVVRGDYLWKISGKQDIYGDPYAWMRLYSYNRDTIKDPDLIYPNQGLKVQREVGPDEYLVAKGDYLARIAGNSAVYGDPTKWTRIYEANKDLVGSDASRIYPYSVLRIPR